MNIGEMLKTMRLERGLTLEELGNMVGVGKSTVRKWESGQIANMRRDKIAALAKALGVPPTMFIDASYEETTAPAVPEDPERDNVMRLYLSLSENNQKRLLDYAELLLKAQQAERDSQV